MKKTISILLVLMLIVTFGIFFRSYSAFAQTVTEEDIYNETNTYNVSNIQKNIEISGYADKQYLVSYNMSSKINRAIAPSPSVTVLTHG